MSYFAGINRLQDSLGNEAEIGLFGGLKTADPTAQISMTFDRPFDIDNDVTNTVTGTGTLTSQYNRSLLRVKSGGVGTAECASKDTVRYIAGTTIESYFTANFVGTPAAGDTMYIGNFDSEDGVYLGYNGTSFVVAYRNINKNGGTEPDVQQTVDVSSYDLTKIHRFRIRFGFLGVGNISFEIMNGTEWKLLHKFQTDGSFTDRTHLGTTFIPMCAQVVSTTGADIEILSGSWKSETYSKNAHSLQDKPFSVVNHRTVAPVAAAERIIVAFKSVATFGSYTNKIKSNLLYTEVATGSEGLYRFSLWKLPSGTVTSGTFNNINTNSVMQVNDTVTTTDATILAALTGQPDFSTYVAVPSGGTGVGSKSLDFQELGIHAHPGDEFVLTIQEIIGGAGTDTQAYSIIYEDLF